MSSLGTALQGKAVGGNSWRVMGMITDLDTITSEGRMGLLGLQKKKLRQRDAIIAYNCL